MKQKSSSSEVEERIAIIRELIDRGASGADVWRYVQFQTKWDISRQQSYNYYNRAYEDMADEAAKVNRAAYFTRSLSRFDYLYQKSIAANDITNARKATEGIVKLLKLDSPGAEFDWQQDATNKGIDPVELVERLKRLSAADADSSDDDSDEAESANGQR